MASLAAALHEATMVRPNATALRLLREHQEAIEAMADNQHDRMLAVGLLVLIDMAEKVSSAYQAVKRDA